MITSTHNTEIREIFKILNLITNFIQGWKHILRLTICSPFLVDMNMNYAYNKRFPYKKNIHILNLFG